jgi:hypothetical protein
VTTESRAVTAEGGLLRSGLNIVFAIPETPPAGGGLIDPSRLAQVSPVTELEGLTTQQAM